MKSDRVLGTAESIWQDTVLQSALLYEPAPFILGQHGYILAY